jgi:hypothetical protein
LGTKYLVVLCAGSALQLAKQSLDEAPYKLSRAVAMIASITFLSLHFSYWIDKPWFLTEGKACCYIHQTFLLGFPNWPVIYFINYMPTSSLAPFITAPSIAISDASDKEEVEEEPEKIDKNAKYTKEDFIANKRGNEREPWVQKPMPFPGKKHKSKEEEHYNRFCEWMRPLFL